MIFQKNLTQKNDYELYIIQELIREAYLKETNKTAILDVEDNKIQYIMLNSWCRDAEDRLSLLQIVCKIIEMYPHRLPNITDYLLCKLSLIEDGNEEICNIYSILFALSQVRKENENGVSRNKTYKRI